MDLLPVLEVYRCVQSEGSRFGRPTIAVRTTGCTHRCYFGEGGWCDSWYTSIKNEFSNDNKYLAMVTESGLWIKDEINDSTLIIKSKYIKGNFLSICFICWTKK